VFTLQENPELIVACGWWSFRKTLYGGDLAPGQKPARRDLLTERASIRAIFTHPDWARQGLGTMMMPIVRRLRGGRVFEVGDGEHVDRSGIV